MLKLVPFLLILYFSFFLLPCFAQNQRRIDSLQNELKKFESMKKSLGSKVTPLMDSIKANLQYEIHNSYKINNNDSALAYSQKCLELSEKIGYKQGIAKGYFGIGEIECNQGSYQLAMDNGQNALKLYKEIGDKQGIANAFAVIGNY